MTGSRLPLRFLLARGARVLVPLTLLASSGLAAAPAMAATASAAGPLSVTISAPDTGVEGTPVPFTVTVTNNTANTTTDASQVDIDVSANLSGALTNSTGGACTRRAGASGTAVICNLAGIPAGGSATVTFSATPTSTGTLSATAAAAFGTIVSQASISVSIGVAPTDVQVTGFATTGSPTAGSTYGYTFQVKDNGPWAAPGVTFSDTLPGVVSLVGVTTNVGTCTASGGTVNCSFGDLAVGGQATLTITVVAPATPQTFTDTASVSMNDTDRQPSNNSVGVTVQVR